MRIVLCGIARYRAPAWNRRPDVNERGCGRDADGNARDVGQAR
jgi:hypothetical protein